MDTVIVALIVAFAAAFLGRRVWKTVLKSRAEQAACNSCGCGDSAERDPLSV